MGRARRTELPDGIYHAYSRGTGPIAVFRDEQDYDTFMRMLRSTERRFQWQVVAFCLMPTHYHVVLEVTVRELSRGMHRLNSSYAHCFNRRHGRTGALFQGRFHTRLVDRDDYLERLCVYVLFNPVRAGHCEAPEKWPWAWSRYPT